MGNKFREELLDGETVLWEGKSEPFAVLSGAYKQKLPVLWIVCAIYIVVFAVAYLPFAFRTQTDSIQLIFACVLACIIPVSLCAHSFSDPKLIKNDLTYVLTNYRAFVIGDERANMMRIDKNTDYRTEIQEDGTEIIYIGDACKTKASASRANTVLGVRKDKENPSKITGLVFYGVKDAANVCSKYAAFAR